MKSATSYICTLTVLLLTPSFCYAQWGVQNWGSSIWGLIGAPEEIPTMGFAALVVLCLGIVLSPVAKRARKYFK